MDLTEEQKSKILEMYNQGIGYGSIGIRLRINSGAVRKYLASVTQIRGKNEGFRARLAINRNFGSKKVVEELM